MKLSGFRRLLLAGALAGSAVFAQFSCTAGPPRDARLSYAKDKAADFRSLAQPAEPAIPTVMPSRELAGARDRRRDERQNAATAPMALPESPKKLGLFASPKPPPTEKGENEYSVRSDGASGDRFARVEANGVTLTETDRLSTFAVDVDTASYSVARRYLTAGQLPPPESVRVEEFVNYFKYMYAPPTAGVFTVHLEGAPSPFSRGRYLLRVGLKGKVVSRSQRKPAHLVFLVDTSGSMQSEDKLPLAKEAIKIAVKNLNENDTVALVTYAGGTADVLPPTPATDRERIFAAVDSLRPRGGTAMGSGMKLAYQHAVQRAAGNAISRVIVLTDGDTNIGPDLSADAMLESVHKYVEEGVTLSTIGFGMGNYRDDLMERLADRGNGNCFYIDSYKEARKVFEEKLTGTLEVIAKDVKVQVEFDPKAVKNYRLVGYENRDIADQDFRNDKVDAGEIGAGHTVTALYEVELAGLPRDQLATVRIRAKEPSGTMAKEQVFRFSGQQLRSSLELASSDFRFAVAVAGTADILRHSRASESWSLVTAQHLAEGAVDGQEDRREFVQLLARARTVTEVSGHVAGR
jgi:Ca-activated chloride channel family protein